jgi:hypothetical protein
MKQIQIINKIKHHKIFNQIQLKLLTRTKLVVLNQLNPQQLLAII